MVRVFVALVGLVALTQSAFAQESSAAATVEAAACAAATGAETKDDAEQVIVTGEPSSKVTYQFFQQLSSNDFCPRGIVTPRGYSCAEVTYAVLDAHGKSLGKCNVPIFRLYSFGFEYVAVTYRKFDCSDKSVRNRTVTF